MTETIPKEHLFYKEGGKFNEELTKVRKTVSKSFENLPFSEKVAFLKKNVPPLKVCNFEKAAVIFRTKISLSQSYLHSAFYFFNRLPKFRETESSCSSKTQNK